MRKQRLRKVKEFAPVARQGDPGEPLILPTLLC